jgi:hypothetical protein
MKRMKITVCQMFSKTALKYQKNLKNSTQFQNVLGRGKQENLNDNAVKTADYVTRMKQIFLW